MLLLLLFIAFLATAVFYVLASTFKEPKQKFENKDFIYTASGRDAWDDNLVHTEGEF